MVIISSDDHDDDHDDDHGEFCFLACFCFRLVVAGWHSGWYDSGGGLPDRLKQDRHCSEDMI